MQPAHACDCWKKIYKKRILKVSHLHLIEENSFDQELVKTPKVNCDSKVHLMLIAYADSLGFLLNPRVAFVVISGSTYIIKFR